MKFTLVKSLRSDPLMRPILVGLLLFSLLFLVVDIFNHHYRSGVSFESFSLYILGNEEEYIDAVPFSTLLEILHIDTFVTMMLLLTLSAIYARLFEGAKIAIHTVMLSAIFSLLSMIASPYMPLAIYLHVTLFWLWHGVSFGMIALSLYKLR